jgi:hypothetical protein
VRHIPSRILILFVLFPAFHRITLAIHSRGDTNQSDARTNGNSKTMTA